jgi:hypothetical protein
LAAACPKRSGAHREEWEMDGNRFDDLARGLAAARSRRGMLKGMAGAALAAIGFERITDDAGARYVCRTEGQTCRANQTCCDGLTCASGKCATVVETPTCPAGQFLCGGACIPNCAPIDDCHVAGECDSKAQACTNPLAADGTACANHGSDQCMIDGHCQAGQCYEVPRDCSMPHAVTRCDFYTGDCLLLVCNTGWRDCNGDQSDGCEIHTMSDVNNCGACGNVCPSNHGTPTCGNGTCGIACDEGFANCDNSRTTGCQTNLMTSKNHCGACSVQCGTGQTCVNGACVSQG